MKTIVFFGVLLFCSDSHALGKLFTTEAQRQQLERPGEQQAQRQLQPANSSSGSVLLNGFVKSQQGRKTLWINGNMHDKTNAVVNSLGRVTVDAQGRRVALKPGQMLDISRHEIREVFDQPASAIINTEEAPAASQPGSSAAQSTESPNKLIPSMVRPSSPQTESTQTVRPVEGLNQRFPKETP